MKSPILKGDRVTLRPHKLSDAPYFVSRFKDPEVARYMLPALFRMSLKDEKKYIAKVLKSKMEYVFAVLDEKNKLIGSTGVHLKSLESKVAGFGIVITEKDHWGKGYAGECIGLLGDLVFKKLKFNRWQLSVFVENERGIRAYEKAGFKNEGRQRQKTYSGVDKKFHDEFLMSILREEWKKKSNH